MTFSCAAGRQASRAILPAAGSTNHSPPKGSGARTGTAPTYWSGPPGTVTTSLGCPVADNRTMAGFCWSKNQMRPSGPGATDVGLYRSGSGTTETDPDAYPLELLTNILATGRSSRLYRRLVDKEQAAMDVEAFEPERVGVVIGTGIGGIAAFERQHEVLLERGPSRVSPHLVALMIPNMAAG